MSDVETVDVPVEDLRLVLDLATVGRRSDEAAYYVGGAARTTAAYRSHDRCQRILENHNNDD